ncbi:glycoside hydrolase family 25 protein [Arsenophonus nasoniae]|uniref:glycoside hydrolase family 25 protein n=1 Tax=Arsenophonus nasoniae TaxID=638 RepID=UPI00387A6601
MVKKTIAISRFQGNIDWNEVSKDDVSYAFSRLGEGETYVDPTFVTNFTRSRDSHINTGAWHIYRAKSSTPEGQANTIITKLKEVGFKKDDNFAFVVNKHVGTNKTATSDEMSDNLYKLMSIILDSDLSICNRQIYIKTNIDTWKNNLNWNKHSEFFKVFNLWVEQWRSEPNYPDILEPWGEGKWKFWEYSSNGRVNGINGDVLISKLNT